MPGRNYALTTHQIRHAAELYRDGYSRGEVARVFAVSEMAVRNALALAGVPMRPRREAAIAGLHKWMVARRRVSSVFEQEKTI